MEINVGAFNVFEPNSEVTVESLVERKLRKPTDSLRVLGNGELKVPLKVKAHHISAGARGKVDCRWKRRSVDSACCLEIARSWTAKRAVPERIKYTY